MATLDARQIQKISTVPGAVPTVAPSNNHLDGSWSVNNIYEGELFVNVADQKTYVRYGATIAEIGSGGGITNIANVGAVGSGIFKDITSGTANFRKLVNAAGVGVAIVGDTIELTNQHTAIADMTDTFFGTLAANDFIVYDGASWVNSQIKTINSNSILGSGNIQVGDVLLGGNTAGANMTIGNNSNFNLQFETNNITRQTIANDGLVTFNGTSGNAGVVRMRELQVLDFDGVTWRSALSSDVTGKIKLSNFVSLGNVSPIDSAIVSNDTVNDFASKTQGQLNRLTNSIPDTTQFANSDFFEAENGMYYPVLNASMFSNSTGLSNHVNGGVVATTAGVNGSGSIYLPTMIDMSRPWRCAVLVEINDSNVINNLQFGDANNSFFTGMQFTSISTSFMNGLLAGATFANQYGFTGGIPAGTKVWIGMAYDGANYVQGFVIPDTPTRYMSDANGGTPVPSFQAAWDNRAFAQSKSPTVQNSGRNCFGGTGSQLQYSLCRFSIQTQSTQNRIIGVWWNQSLAGPKDGQLQPPAMIRTVIAKDESATIVIPKTLNYQQTDIVLLHHPNGNNGGFGFTDGTNGSPSELAKIVKNGYLVCAITGADNQSDIAGATSSNWGAPTGQFYRKLLIEWVRDNVPGLRYLFVLGQSMGGLNAARFAIQYSNQVRGVAVVSGAMDLSDSYSNRGFSSIINTAFGTWWLVINPIVGLNPSLIVTATANAIIGATSISVSALSSQIPNGTILTLRTGTGQTTVVTTALANAGATSISVTALTVQVNNGATYGTANYYTQINYGFTQPDPLYYYAPHVWRDVYAQATSYAVNDIIVTAATGTTVNTYKWVDPTLTPSPLKNIPFKLWHGDSDALIPIAQATGFQSSLNAAGGSCSLVTVVGGTHLSANCYDGQGIVDFFNSLT